MEKLEIYNKVRDVPKEAQKPIQGGRLKGKTDINPMWRIKILTELFGPCGVGWYYKTTRKWTESAGDEVAAFVDIELFFKDGDSWSMPICGTGGSMLAEKEKGGLHLSDECYKMATTDAISVACKQLGIGADIYWSADRTKYDEPVRSENPPESSLLVNLFMIRELKQEVKRTGWTIEGLLKWLKTDQMEKITVDKYKFAMEKLKQKPDKAAPEIPSVQPEEYVELPFS